MTSPHNKPAPRPERSDSTRLQKRLEQEIERREKAEVALKASKAHYGKLLARSRLAEKQKRLLAHNVLLAQEEERRQISRALHDEVSQILTGINVRLVALTQLNSTDTKSFEKTIATTRKLVENSVSIVHKFARELRPVLLDDLGLIPALHTFMKTMTKQSGIHIQFKAFSGVEKLSNAKRTALYRVVQGALNNVVRHAEASNVIVMIEKHPEGIRVEIKDNGKAFQVDRVLQSKRFNRLGLLSMRERVEMFGGTLEIESLPGKGTTISGVIPMDKTKD